MRNRNPLDGTTPITEAASKDGVDRSTLFDDQMLKLQGKVALVTGQGGETSLATANHLIDQGAQVFLVHGACPDWTAALHRQMELTCIRANGSDVGERDRLLAHIERETGKLDIVFANAVADEYPPLSDILKDPYGSMTNLDFTGAH